VLNKWNPYYYEVGMYLKKFNNRDCEMIIDSLLLVSLQDRRQDGIANNRRVSRHDLFSDLQITIQTGDGLGAESRFRSYAEQFAAKIGERSISIRWEGQAAIERVAEERFQRYRDLAKRGQSEKA